MLSHYAPPSVVCCSPFTRPGFTLATLMIPPLGSSQAVEAAFKSRALTLADIRFCRGLPPQSILTALRDLPRRRGLRTRLQLRLGLSAADLAAAVARLERLRDNPVDELVLRLDFPERRRPPRFKASSRAPGAEKRDSPPAYPPEAPAAIAAMAAAFGAETTLEAAASSNDGESSLVRLAIEVLRAGECSAAAPSHQQRRQRLRVVVTDQEGLEALESALRAEAPLPAALSGGAAAAGQAVSPQTERAQGSASGAASAAVWARRLRVVLGYPEIDRGRICPQDYTYDRWHPPVVADAGAAAALSGLPQALRDAGAVVEWEGEAPFRVKGDENYRGYSDSEEDDLSGGFFGDGDDDDSSRGGNDDDSGEPRGAGAPGSGRKRPRRSESEEEKEDEEDEEDTLRRKKKKKLRDHQFIDFIDTSELVEHFRSTRRTKTDDEF